MKNITLQKLSASENEEALSLDEKNEIKEKKSRSVIKAVTYRLSATIATFTLAYVFTGNLEIASQIGFLDFFVKFSIYYINERLWSRTAWGYEE